MRLQNKSLDILEKTLKSIETKIEKRNKMLFNQLIKNNNFNYNISDALDIRYNNIKEQIRMIKIKTTRLGDINV